MVHIRFRDAFLLTLPTVLWAANAVLGRMAIDLVSPILFNTMRWGLAALILLPMGWRVLQRDSGLWENFGRFSFLGLLGVGCYNSLLYLALRTSNAINVTLIGASMPIWMFLIGIMFYGEHPKFRQFIGALISLLGVAIVLTRGDLSAISRIHFVAGDFFILLATILWGLYSWMLGRPGKSSERQWPWASFLLAQVLMGVFWSFCFTVVEGYFEPLHIEWSIWVVLLLLFVSIGPSVIAYRSWGLGVQALGPEISAFFANLIPLFTAIMSAALLGELPQLFHVMAFICIVLGIIISLKKRHS